MRRRLSLTMGCLAALAVAGCSDAGAVADGTMVAEAAVATAGTTPIVPETTPPTTVAATDPLLRTLVGAEWEIVSLDGVVVADVLNPVGVRFWGDGTYSFRGTCPSGSYQLDGSEIDFDPGGDGDGPALIENAPPEPVLLQARLCSIVDHGMVVSSFSDREILASTVFPRAFELILRPMTSPPA